MQFDITKYIDFDMEFVGHYRGRHQGIFVLKIAPLDDADPSFQNLQLQLSYLFSLKSYGALK